jgi:hypothetical protein
MAGEVAQGVGPEFKPQYWKKKKIWISFETIEIVGDRKAKGVFVQLEGRQTWASDNQACESFLINLSSLIAFGCAGHTSDSIWNLAVFIFPHLNCLVFLKLFLKGPLSLENFVPVSFSLLPG